MVKDINNWIGSQIPVVFELRTTTGDVLRVFQMVVRGGGNCYLPFLNGIWTGEEFWTLRGATEALCAIREKI